MHRQPAAQARADAAAAPAAAEDDLKRLQDASAAMARQLAQLEQRVTALSSGSAAAPVDAAADVKGGGAAGDDQKTGGAGSSSDDDGDDREAEAASAPWSNEDIFGQVICEALRPLAGLSQREQRRSTRRLWWLSLLLVATAGLQLGLVSIVCADVLAGPSDGGASLPPDWYATTHLLLARLAGRRDLPSLLVGPDPPPPADAPGPDPPGPDAFGVGACSCRLWMPLNETAFMRSVETFDYATGGDPPCFLASVNMTECGVEYYAASSGAPLAAGALPEAERRAADEVLRRADARMLRRKYSALLASGVAAEAAAAAGETSPARARRLACTSLAVVVIAIFVRREVAHAMLGARIVLSHVGGALPRFFSPIYLTYAPHHAPVRLHAGAAALLLLVPLLHAGIALAVMLAASLTTFNLDLSPSPVAVILNSCAMLFVIEIDDLIGAWTRERTLARAHVDAGEVEERTLIDRRDARSVSMRARARRAPALARALGHCYVAVLGFVCYVEVGIATLDLSRALISEFLLLLVLHPHAPLKP